MRFILSFAALACVAPTMANAACVNLSGLYRCEEEGGKITLSRVRQSEEQISLGGPDGPLVLKLNGALSQVGMAGYKANVRVKCISEGIRIDFFNEEGKKGNALYFLRTADGGISHGSEDKPLRACKKINEEE